MSGQLKLRWNIGRYSIALLLLLVFPLVSATAAGTDGGIPIYTVQVIKAFPHDPKAFTEGLLYKDGFLYESTGLEGQSSLRKVRLETGEVVLQRDLPAEYFGEGIVDWDDELIDLTWRSHIGFVSDLRNLKMRRDFRYEGEGWGLTRSDSAIFMSDGTPELRVLDPKTLRELRRIPVTAQGRPVTNLNELEWVKGEILANVWLTNVIARIDPQTGNVTGWIDLTGILQSQGKVTGKVDVLNGIAYDQKNDRLFVTGKLWPYLFQIRLVSH